MAIAVRARVICRLFHTHGERILLTCLFSSSLRRGSAIIAIDPDATSAGRTTRGEITERRKNSQNFVGVEQRFFHGIVFRNAGKRRPDGFRQGGGERTREGEKERDCISAAGRIVHASSSRLDNPIICSPTHFGCIRRDFRETPPLCVHGPRAGSARLLCLTSRSASSTSR